jgi:hypothetical protein
MNAYQKSAYFHKAPYLFEIDAAEDFTCALSANITEAKCYLYLVSRSPSCCGCLQKLARVRMSVLAGEFSDLEKAPILRFFLTALTGMPGVSEEVQRLRNRKNFRLATGWIPPSAKDKIGRKLKSALRRIEPQAEPEKPYDERLIPPEKQSSAQLIVLETEAKARKLAEERIKPVIQRRKKKPVWVGKCEGCGEKKEIHAWNMCKACLEEELKQAGVLKR